MAGQLLISNLLPAVPALVTGFYWSAYCGRRARDLILEPAQDVSDEPRIDVSVLMELIGAALGAGVAVPRGLQATGEAIGGSDGLALNRVGAALRMGASWSEAWRDAPKRLQPIGNALRISWEDGAAPREALRAAADDLRREYRTASRTAAAKLAVRLVLPLGLCLLPAFVLLGLMPVLLSLGGTLLAT